MEKKNGNYYNGLCRDYKVYIGVMLGSWKIKWKLLHWDTVYRVQGFGLKAYALIEPWGLALMFSAGIERQTS